jgi:hypothetical protein
LVESIGEVWENNTDVVVSNCCRARGEEEKHIDRGRAVPENVSCHPRCALSWKGWQVLCWVGAGRAWTWSCWPVVKAEEFLSVKPQLNNIFMACNTMIEAPVKAEEFLSVKPQSTMKHCN